MKVVSRIFSKYNFNQKAIDFLDIAKFLTESRYVGVSLEFRHLSKF